MNLQSDLFQGLYTKSPSETYLTPVQFMAITDHPIINQWWKYIAYGSSVEIQRERNDFEGVKALMEGMMRQESMVLERQGVEEIGQPNLHIIQFNITKPNIKQFFWNRILLMKSKSVIKKVLKTHQRR